MATEDVIARLRVEGGSQFTQQMNQARGSVTGVGQGAEQSKRGLSGSAASLAKAAAAAGIAYKGYGFLKSSVNTTLDLAKSTAAFSRASGLSTKESQAWVTVAKSRGIETRQLQIGMATLGRNLGGLGNNSKASTQALNQLGLSAKTLNALPTDLRMGMIADSFKALPDGAEKAALAQRLFGRSGQQLLPILNAGSKGLRDELAAANKLVPGLGKNQKATLDLARQQRMLGMATTGLKVSVGTALLPVMTTLAQAAVPIISGFGRLLQVFPPLRFVVLGLAAAFVLMWLGVTGPIALVVGAVVAVGAAFMTLYNKVGWFRNAINAVWSWIKSNWPLLLAILTGPFGAAVLLIVRNFNTIKNAASSVFNAIKSGISAAASFVSGRVSAIVSFIMSIPRRIAGLAGQLLAAGRQGANSLLNGLRSAVSGAANIGREIINAVVNAIKGAGSVIIDAIKSLVPGPLKSAVNAIFATGGIVRAQLGMAAGGGRTALVGERGPEIASLPAGTRITPLPPPQLMPSQLMGDGGGTIINRIYLDRRQIAEAMGSYTADKQAAR